MMFNMSQDDHNHSILDGTTNVSTPEPENKDGHTDKEATATSKAQPVLVGLLSTAEHDSFEPSSVINSHNQWNKILNLQANLHSLAQANLVAQTQERIAKEYGIATNESGNHVNDVIQSEVEPVKDYGQKNKTKLTSAGNEENNKEKGTEHICVVPGCGRIFSSIGNLKFHLQAVHKIQTQTLECKVEGCSRKFAWPAHYKYHQLTHTGERLHQCDVAGCEKRFYTAQRLKVHKRCHTGERPFICSVKGCNKAFSTYGNLRNHERTHTGEKPFVCDHKGCKKNFAEASSLKKHRLVHSGAKPFTCAICGKSFTQSGSRNVHMKRHQLDGEDGHRGEEPVGDDTTTQHILLNQHNVLVLKAGDDEILQYKELHTTGDTLVFTQTGAEVVTVSTRALQQQGDQLELSQTMLAPQALEENASTLDSDIMNSATGANVVVLTQPQEMVPIATNLHDNQHTGTQEIVYTSDLLPVGLDHEEIANSIISHHDIMGPNVIIDVKADESIPIVIVPMLEGDRTN